jgi:hypothetical protein
MKKEKKITPRISEQTAEWIPANFANMNAGAEYILEAFPVLYRRTLEEIKGVLTKSELMVMIDVFNGHALTPRMSGQELWWSVSEGIKYDSLDQKWDIKKEDMQKKMEGLTTFQCACLEIWANGFWYAEKGIEENRLDVEKHVEGLL